MTPNYLRPLRRSADSLRCRLCSRRVSGVTGLNELHNLQAHYGEHHHPITLYEAMELRLEMEEEEDEGNRNSA